MTKISSGSTFFFKRIFPALWFGLVALFLVAGIASGVVGKAPIVLISPVLMVIIGVVLMRGLVWDLVDEVQDCGDSLLVRNDGQEEIIPLSNIMNVSVTSMVNPPRVTLRLVVPGRFGNEVVFSPSVGMRLNLFARLPVIDDLVLRVDQARTKRST